MTREQLARRLTLISAALLAFLEIEAEVTRRRRERRRRERRAA